MARKFFVGGNFKMNGTVKSITEIVSRLNDAKLNPDVEVVIAPPTLFLQQAIKENKQSTVSVGAQNIYNQTSGAFTGESGADMFKDIGVKWVILGHSERRSLLKESAEEVAEKTKFAVDQGFDVILCCGEQKEDRESGKTMDVVAAQLKPVISVLKESDWSHIVIAYEPVWAIGTGLTATPKDAEETHKEIREFISKEVSPKVAEEVRILYGGSVSAKTAPELHTQPDIDGFLVGGASLKPEFVDIINV